MERVNLTAEQALAALIRNPDGGAHMISNPSVGLMIGADWDKKTTEAAIREARELHIGGHFCRANEHGLVVDTADGSRYFAHADNNKLTEYEKEQHERTRKNDKRN